MRSSLQRFADSIPNSIIPREGYLGLNAMKLQLGPLSLTTPGHIDSARKFLHDLQRHSWRNGMKVAQDKALMKAGSMPLRQDSSKTHIDPDEMRPFTVDGIGFSDGIDLGALAKGIASRAFTYH
ncbi:hypothetical protein ABVK25_003783 [Lepraria finkii]|uniref:Uncharacterized protein n=1 Tax=Lepraria finkii TaxID=1340010 RepID=A0ABR4BEI5_9LECA